MFVLRGTSQIIDHSHFQVFHPILYLVIIFSLLVGTVSRNESYKILPASTVNSPTERPSHAFLLASNPFRDQNH